MNVKSHPKIAEIIGKKLAGIEGVPKAEQTKMVRRAIKAAIEYVEPLENSLLFLSNQLLNRGE